MAPTTQTVPALSRRPHPSPDRSRSWQALIATPALALLLAGCSSLGAGDDAYRPLVGQHGKDVMWVPTLDDAVTTMLERAKVNATDLVYDLGAGDGRIAIEAGRRYGARAVGIEYHAELASLAQRSAERAGVADRVRIIHGDIFKEDFSAATVLTLYLGRELNLKLKPTILRMPPGTRVVSNSFDMGLWQPDDVIRNPKHNDIFFWVVPARIDGEWTVTGWSDQGPAVLRLRQRFQRVEGELASGGRPVQVSGRVEGKRLVLAIEGESQRTATLIADIADRQFTGTLGNGRPVSAMKHR